MSADTATRRRPRSLPSVTTKLATELGNLYVTVCLDEDGNPFEVFGSLGKAGSLQHGVTELACRLVSLHLRRGTPLDEIVDQRQGISEMQPWPNVMEDGSTVYVRGLGDGIALILRATWRPKLKWEWRNSGWLPTERTALTRPAKAHGAVSYGERPRSNFPDTAITEERQP